MAIIGTNTKKAQAILERGGLVAIPTETVYGLAGNGLDPSCIRLIYEVKNRPQYNPMILHIGKTDQLHDLIKELPTALDKLINSFWPGPLTILVEKTKIVPDIVTSGSPKVAIRMPAHPLSLKLLKELEFPLAAPSANPFTYISPTTAEHVNKMLGDKIPYILNGGPCRSGLESTIVGWDHDRLTVYRLGTITLEAIEKVISVQPLLQKVSEQIMTPGQSKLHYAPRTPTLLFTKEDLDISKWANKKIGMITFAEAYTDPRIVAQIILSKNHNITEAAAKMYSAMHQLDEASVDIILIEKMPESALGRTMNDRLTRAANQNKEKNK